MVPSAPCKIYSYIVYEPGVVEVGRGGGLTLIIFGGGGHIVTTKKFMKSACVLTIIIHFVC